MAEGDKKAVSARLSGSERAAILLMSLGDAEAANILKHLGPKEVQKVGAAMARTSGVSKDTALDVISAFVTEIEGQAALAGSDEYIKNLMTQALGEDKANQVLDRILLGHSSKGLEALKWMEPKSVAELIQRDHPQIISIVLSCLEPDQAAAILSLLPERTRSDSIMRIASLDNIHSSALMELDTILEKQFSGNTNLQSSSIDGMKTAANILNFMDSSIGTEIMDEIKESDEEMGQGIEDLMFDFENIVDIDDRGIQRLLREVSSATLVLALKAADEDTKEKIFSNLSKRAGEMLRDDLEVRGPAKLSDVEAAQREVLAIVRYLKGAGELSIGGKGGDEYV
jgi:flagellar motor switch protein FliG